MSRGILARTAHEVDRVLRTATRAKVLVGVNTGCDLLLARPLLELNVLLRLHVEVPARELWPHRARDRTAAARRRRDPKARARRQAEGEQQRDA